MIPGVDNLPVLETEFLLGLRKGDKRNKTARSILSRAEEGKMDKVVIAGSAVMEIAFGLRGRFDKPDIVEILELIRGMTPALPILNLDTDMIMEGLKIELRLPDSNLFDCLHAATALRHDGVIVSSDPFYESVAGMRRLDLSELLHE